MITYIDFSSYSTPSPMVSKAAKEEDGRQTSTTQDHVAERYEIFKLFIGNDPILNRGATKL